MASRPADPHNPVITMGKPSDREPVTVGSVTTSPYASGLTSPVVKNDHDLAAELAEQAGELLIAVRAELSEADVALRKDEGDRRDPQEVRRGNSLVCVAPRATIV